MRYLLGFFSSLLFISCAQVVAPTGGEKDINPPTILSTKPDNLSSNFSTSVIVINFDEFIKLSNLKEQLIVSPPLKYELQTSISGKSLKIEIKDTLKENTTYVLNFGDAIVDITENNPISNYQYVFSTGNNIDSLSIRGKVIDAFNLKASEGMLVMLYADEKNDSAPLLHLPDYVGRTIKKGEFEITNIKAGEYKLFALKDANANFLFDRPDEEIAFKSSSINIDKNIDSLKLYSFQEENLKQYIEGQEEKEAHLILDFKKSTQAFTYSILDTITPLLTYLNENKDSAFFWWRQMPASKIKMVVSDDPLFIDTIKFTIDSLSKKSMLKLKTPLAATQNYYAPIHLTFTRPIAKINEGQIKIYNSDSSMVDFQIESAESKDQKSFLLTLPFEEDSSYRISIFPNAFKDIYGKTMDTVDHKFSFNKASDFGTLEVEIKSNYIDQKIIQLLNGKGDILDEKIIKSTAEADDKRVRFDYLRNGSYKLKLIIEREPNGKWDSGNYLKAEQAEKTILFDEEIRIRANWDKEIEWIIK